MCLYNQKLVELWKERSWPSCFINYYLRPLWPKLSMELELAFCSLLYEWESLTPPGRGTNPSQVSPEQTLVLIYQPRKDGKLSEFWQKRRSHKRSDLGRAGVRTQELIYRRQLSSQLRQPIRFKTKQIHWRTNVAGQQRSTHPRSASNIQNGILFIFICSDQKANTIDFMFLLYFWRW